MATKAGERREFENGRAEVVVTKGGAADVLLEPDGEGKLQVGKRYSDATTGIEVMVTKAGEGVLVVNGAPMVQAQPKKTKSSD